jgi:hypothetical protein
MCEGHVMRACGLSQKYVQCFLTNNRRKRVSRKIRYWSFSSVTTTMLSATGRFSQLLLYKEEGRTSQLLVAWFSFGHLCQLSIVSAAKRLIQSPCHSGTFNISAEAQPIHISPFMSAVACATPSLLAPTFPIIPETPKGRASRAAARGAGL